MENEYFATISVESEASLPFITACIIDCNIKRGVGSVHMILVKLSFINIDILEEKKVAGIDIETRNRMAVNYKKLHCVNAKRSIPQNCTINI